MRKILFVLCLLIVIDITVLAQGGLRYTIQVREFENRSGWSGQWRLGDAWGAVLTDKLQQSGRFTVIGKNTPNTPNTQLPQILTCPQLLCHMLS